MSPVLTLRMHFALDVGFLRSLDFCIMSRSRGQLRLPSPSQVDATVSV